MEVRVKKSLCSLFSTTLEGDTEECDVTIPLLFILAAPQVGCVVPVGFRFWDDWRSQLPLLGRFTACDRQFGPCCRGNQSP
ncbi:unnamed protein product [Boreogadus saida]